MILYSEILLISKFVALGRAAVTIMSHELFTHSCNLSSNLVFGSPQLIIPIFIF